MTSFFVTKTSGDREEFSEDKLRRSLMRVSASPEAVDDVISRVKSQLYNGISTRAIYRKAFRILKKHKGPPAARYHLKRGLIDLGPEGFLFEILVSHLLYAMGFLVNTGQHLPGKCVMHEVDVVAQRGNRHLFVECKLHQRLGLKSDVKVSLYTQARFQDIVSKLKSDSPNLDITYESWLVTNTAFTLDAITYAECMGMTILSFNYPATHHLAYYIDRYGLYPITCLTHLTVSAKKQLLSRKVILCKTLVETPSLLEEVGVTGDTCQKVLEEIRQLCDF